MVEAIDDILDAGEGVLGLQETGEIAGALNGYADYLDAVRPTGSFRFEQGAGEDADSRESRRLTWRAVAGEALDLAEEHQQREHRFDLALELIRLRPDEADGYRHVFALEGDADAKQARLIAFARQIVSLLAPVLHAELGGSNDRLADPPEAAELPRLDENLDDQSHDEQLVHPAERVRSNAIGRVLGKYVSSEQSSDARLHCELIREDTYPLTFRLTRELSAIAGIETPDVLISHQPAGIRALGPPDDPFC